MANMPKTNSLELAVATGPTPTLVTAVEDDEVAGLLVGSKGVAVL